MPKPPQTPPSNTGSPRQITTAPDLRADLDYLVVVGSCDLDRVIHLVWCVFGTSFDFDNGKPGCRGNVYEMIVKSAQSIELGYSRSTTVVGAYNIRLSIPGKPLNHIRPDRKTHLLNALYEMGCKCTRLDWRIDDYSCMLSIDEVEKCARDGDFTGARKWVAYHSGVTGDSTVGRTVYFGSSGSNKLVRIYDKAAESGGIQDCVRYEVQWRDELAHAVFSSIAGYTDWDSSVMAASDRAVGAIGFVRRDNSVLSRCDLIPWWDAFVSAVGTAVKTSVPKLQSMVSDKARWIERQVIRTISVISACWGRAQTMNWLSNELSKSLAKPDSDRDAYVKSWNDRRTVESQSVEDWDAMSKWNVV